MLSGSRAEECVAGGRWAGREAGRRDGSASLAVVSRKKPTLGCSERRGVTAGGRRISCPVSGGPGRESEPASREGGEQTGYRAKPLVFNGLTFRRGTTRPLPARTLAQMRNEMDIAARTPDVPAGSQTAFPAGTRVGESRPGHRRSEEHTSELQSLAYLVCRLLLEKKKKKTHTHMNADELVCRHD